MDLNEDRDFDPIIDTPEETLPEAEADSSYHGAGVGQQEQFGPSPWDVPMDPEPAPEPEPQPRWEPPTERIYQPQPEAAPRKRKKTGRTGKRILAAVLALAVLGGACGLTAWMVAEADPESPPPQGVCLLCGSRTGKPSLAPRRGGNHIPPTLLAPTPGKSWAFINFPWN